MAERLHAIIKAAAGPLAETLVRDARLCQGRQRRLLFQDAAKFQGEVRDARLRRQGEARRWRHVAELLRADRADPADEARIGALVKKAVS